MMLQKMSAVGIPQVPASEPGEAEKLAQRHPDPRDALLRDPESFAALAKEVFPDVAANRSPEIRSNLGSGMLDGEEAYSSRSRLLEYLGDRAGDSAVQVFADHVTSRRSITRETASIRKRSPPTFRRSACDGSFRRATAATASAR